MLFWKEIKHKRKKTRLRHTVYYLTVIGLLLIAISILLHKRKVQKKETELIAARQYIEGLENERKRLAKDLHDGVCNDLLGAILQIQQHISSEDKRQLPFRRWKKYAMA